MWSTAAFFLVLMFVNDTLGFHLEVKSVNPHGNNNHCAEVRCVENITEDASISALVSMSVYKVGDLGENVLLASVPEVKSKASNFNSSEVKVYSKLTEKDGELILFLNQMSECETQDFVCEIVFRNRDGFIVKKEKQQTINTNSNGGVLSTETCTLTDEMKKYVEKIETSVNKKLNRYIKFESKINEFLDNVDFNEQTNIKKAIISTYFDDNSNDALFKIIQLQCSRDDDPGLPERLTFRISKNKEALCDTKTDGGGWILIQRRINGAESFQRTWAEYKNGFGKLSGDFWLGNDWLSRLTLMGYSVLRFDMTYEGNSYFAEYRGLKVENEENFYRISFSTYRGNASDQFHHHNGMKFTTKDKDNDEHEENCSDIRKAGWWYKACQWVNVNALWRSVGDYTGVYWYTITPDQGSLDTIEIKIRVE